jgi:MoxR-like ATPase
MERKKGAPSGETTQQSPEVQKRSELILKYIEDKIVGKNECADRETEMDISEYLRDLAPYEKANILYEKMMVFVRSKGVTPDPELVSEIKLLVSDSAVRDIFSTTYAEARVDAKDSRRSSISIGEGRLSMSDMSKQIEDTEDRIKVISRKLFLRQVADPDISTERSRLARLTKRLHRLESEKDSFLRLDGMDAVRENTDVIAQLSYDKFLEYKRQSEENNFVDLPSRREIHQEIINSMQNGRWPVLVGEAGTGKSQQADAAAMELTGRPTEKVAAGPKTSVDTLIGERGIDHESGGSMVVYGPLMRAYTGRERSNDEELTHKTGGICRIDEANRLGDEPYSELKEARQKRSGDDFHGQEVLPGAGVIMTMNPSGPRYPGRRKFDAAMQREVAEIVVDFTTRKETYDFMVAKLLDKDGHIGVTVGELSPVYEKKDIPEDEQSVLSDGSRVVAHDELVSDPKDRRHGSLYRLSHAVRTLQDCFNYGNVSDSAEIPAEALRFVEDAGGVVSIVESGGEPLTLTSSLITLGELESWMKGFHERKLKKDRDFHVDSLADWLKLKINTLIKHSKSEDRAKLVAIFEHFNLLGTNPPISHDARPITPKEIGYLDTDVPRPLYVERVVSEVVVDESKKKEVEGGEVRDIKYTTVDVILDSGERMKMNIGNLKVETEAFGEIELSTYNRIIHDGKEYIFAGREGSESGDVQDGAFLVKYDEAELYKIMTPTDIEMGKVAYDIGDLAYDIEIVCPSTAVATA